MLCDEIDPLVYAFLRSCLEESGTNPTSPVLVDAMISGLLPRFEKWLMLDLLNSVPSHQEPLFEAFFQNDPTPDEVLNFMAATLADFDKTVTQSMQSFKESYRSASEDDSIPAPSEEQVTAFMDSALRDSEKSKARKPKPKPSAKRLFPDVPNDY